MCIRHTYEDSVKGQKYVLDFKMALKRLWGYSTVSLLCFFLSWSMCNSRATEEQGHYSSCLFHSASVFNVFLYAMYFMRIL